MQFRPSRVLAAFAVAMATVPAIAQSPSASQEQRGFTEIETFQGTFNSSGKLLKLDSQLGYDFNRHVEVFSGIPLYIVNVPSGTTATGTSTSSGTSAGIGNFYVGSMLSFPNPTLNYRTAITAGAPTGNTKQGLSAGSGTIDWTNHIDKRFGRITPYLDAGLGNTVPDSALILRSFTSTGAIAHFEEGAEYQLARRFTVGASAYEIAPLGTQKVYSKLIQQGQTAGTKGTGQANPFQTASVTSGTDLTRENGFNAWLGFQPSAFWLAELGYSRSATYGLNSLSFNLGINVGKLLRSNSNK